MKQLSLILSSISIVLAGILFYLYGKENKSVKQLVNTMPASQVNGDVSAFPIAYFDMDSLQNNYQYFKDVSNSLKTKEEGLNNELTTMERAYQKKIAEWQQKGSTMSQAETEVANREYQQMQQQFTTRREEMQQTMENLKRDEVGKIRKRLEDFLKDYNKDKRYKYIFSYSPEFMFFKDTIYNITPDLIKGLNELYKKKE